MTLNRVHARRIGFVLVVLAGVWFELSPWGARAAAAVLDLQFLALDYWSSHAPAGDAATTDVAPGTTARRPDSSPALAGDGDEPGGHRRAGVVGVAPARLGESASSVVALAALLAVSTMMLPRDVLVPTAGPGLAIVAGVLGRRALEAVIAARDRRGRRGGAVVPMRESAGCRRKPRS